MVRFDEIRDALLNVPDPLEACKILTDRANQAGGHDNITVIVARFDGEGLASPSGLDDLHYRKYALPEDPSGYPSEMALRAAAVESYDGPESIATQPPVALPVAERLSDHGPSRSKVTHTIVGAQMSQAALAAIAASAPEPPPGVAAGGWREQPKRRDESESIDIPTSNAPAWMVGGIVLTALALALVAGYYLLR
jgi:protein phosphatase